MRKFTSLRNTSINIASNLKTEKTISENPLKPLVFHSAAEFFYYTILANFGSENLDRNHPIENTMMNIALRTSRMILLSLLGYRQLTNNLSYLCANEMLLLMFSGFLSAH